MHDIKLFQQFSEIRAIFTTRESGISKVPFASLNLAYHVGDEAANVEINRKILKKAFGDSVTLHAMDQVHGSEVCHVDNETLSPSCDALITDRPKQLLMVMVADCIPILFYDTKNRAVAAIHTGRAGAFGNIVKATFEKMQQAFGTASQDLYVATGPSIHACCYEVGQDIAQEAKQQGLDFAVSAKEETFYLNIQSIVRRQLQQLQIPSEQIEISTICTACETDSYFSYRKEGQTGRFCGAIMIK